MLLYALAFLLGDGLLQWLPTLPDVPGFVALSCMLVLLSYWIKKTWFRVFVIMVVGFAYSAWYAHHMLVKRLPLPLAGKLLMVTGTVMRVPSTNHDTTHFRFHITQPFDKEVRLSWHHPRQPINVGQVWRFKVRLQPPRGTANLGGFDFTAWSVVQGLHANGYVVRDSSNQLLMTQGNVLPWQRWRQAIFTALLPLLPETQTAHWLPALIMGERQGISQSEWHVLRMTGTNHLMAIAGLHIGLIVALVHACCLFIWRRMAVLCLYVPAHYAAAIVGLGVAIFYSMLAGFSLPTQRASIMLTVVVLGYVSKRVLCHWHVWAMALILVLLINPLQILTDSFWLSFGTLSLIFYGMHGRLGVKGIWWKWGRVQWVIGIGLVPLSLLLFHECSFISFIANTLAIPWMLFTILPCCLLAVFTLFLSPPLAHVCLTLADYALRVLMYGLTWLSTLPLATVVVSAPVGYVVAAMVGVLIALSPLPLLPRLLSILWFLPLLFYQPARPALGEIKLTVLDVGQGLSVVIETATHTLLYDAGARFLSGSDMGERVVVPYLHYAGIKKLNALVISHDDNDHRGGVSSVLASMATQHIVASRRQPYWPATLCERGQTWQWDNVAFTFLHPHGQHSNKNNDSCVLRISNGYYHVLLTGDIEKAAEQVLVKRAASQLAATILIAPHHGSKTSSTSPFIQAVMPRYVVYSVGYHNQYHFPHPSVVKAYTAIKAQQVTTAEWGMLQFHLPARPSKISTEYYRQRYRHYWDKVY